MRDMQERLAEPRERDRYRQAHERYLSEREQIDHIPEINGVSAGGMPDRVKCLHVLVGQALASGPGVNVFGDEALAEITERGLVKGPTCPDRGAGE
jgi:hypothetical protein